MALYNNYYFILQSIVAFLAIAYSGMTAGLGNSLVVESGEKNLQDLRKFLFVNSWLVGWCSICLLCLYQPFMMLWLGEEYLLSFPMVILFAVYFYILQIRKVVINYKDAAGVWWEDRFRPYVCMVVNIVSNIVLVQYIGLIGIVISTILSMVISIPWETYTVFKHVFKSSSKDYYFKLSYYVAVTLVAAGLAYWGCSYFEEGIVGFLMQILICVTVPNLIFYLVYQKRVEFKYLTEIVRRFMPV